jgi:hypothetical protein
VSAPHLALMALMARSLSVDPRPNGTIGEPSLRNQKKGSIYLSFYRARAGEGGRAISAISVISSGGGSCSAVPGGLVSAHIAHACARLGVRGAAWLSA